MFAPHQTVQRLLRLLLSLDRRLLFDRLRRCERRRLSLERDRDRERVRESLILRLARLSSDDGPELRRLSLRPESRDLLRLRLRLRLRVLRELLLWRRRSDSHLLRDWHFRLCGLNAGRLLGHWVTTG